MWVAFDHDQLIEMRQHRLDEIIGMIDFFVGIQAIVFSAQGHQHAGIIDLAQQLAGIQSALQLFQQENGR